MDSANFSFPNPSVMRQFWERLKPGTWIVLEDIPSPFACCEALLICQLSDSEWLSWIPEYGEYHLFF